MRSLVLENNIDINSILNKVGIKFDEKVIRQILFIEEKTKFILDEINSINYGSLILYKENFSKEEIKLFSGATILSDLGKAGSFDMTIKQKKLILNMYGTENVGNLDIKSIEDFFYEDYKEKYLLSDKEVVNDLNYFDFIISIYGGFDKLRSEDIKMIDFWSNGHVNWLLQSVDINEKVNQTALLHHILDGVNPVDLVNIKDFTFIDAFVGLIDKYDAFRNRSSFNHEKSIKILEGIINKAFYIDGNIEKHVVDSIKLNKIKEIFLKALDTIKNNPIESFI